MLGAAKNLLLNAAETTGGLLNNGDATNFGSGESALNNNGDFYRIFYYIFAVLLVAAALFFLRRYLMRRMKTVNNGAYMRVLDRIAVSQDKQIALIELKNKAVVVGITPQRIEALTEFSHEELEELPRDGEPGGKNTRESRFLELIALKLNKNKNNADNGGGYGS